MSYPHQYVRDLLGLVDIVEIVRLSIRLKTRGSENQEFVGLCPFHNERTPSFVIQHNRQFYHCFGCGTHGNAISFLKEYGGMTYEEAVRFLARRTGLYYKQWKRKAMK